jgi:hypothetical protein
LLVQNMHQCKICTSARNDTELVHETTPTEPAHHYILKEKKKNIPESQKKAGSQGMPEIPRASCRTPSRTKTPASSPDPRSKHPAILALKELMGRYPDKLIYDEIIGLLGEDFDRERLRRCATEWAKVSTNKGNLKVWLFDWYANGIPPARNGNSAGHRSSRNQSPETPGFRMTRPGEWNGGKVK